MDHTTRTEIANQIGARMQAARECRRVSQEIVAIQLGITADRLAAYEHGTESVSVVELERLSQILAIPILYFFEGCAVCGNA